MRKTVFSSFLILTAVLVLGWQIRTSHAIPPSFTISGVLKAADGTPLAGTYPVEILFYKTKTDTEVLYTRWATVPIVEGVFSIQVLPPPALLQYDELWYTLAVDVDGDGIGPSDLFPDRFQIAAVPFALSAKPVTLFSSHGGIVSQSTSSLSNFTLFVHPFTTPSGGVLFNRMAVGLTSAETAYFAFGVYDQTGNRVYNSGPLDSPSGSIGNPRTHRIPVESGYLAPSTKYYAAWAHPPGNVGILRGLSHVVSDTGVIVDYEIKESLLEKGLPETVWLPRIATTPSGVLNITFEWTDEGAPSGRPLTFDSIDMLDDLEATGPVF